jgi:hypothetical protein
MAAQLLVSPSLTNDESGGANQQIGRNNLLHIMREIHILRALFE